jgi:hypothetical protein
MCTSKLIAKGSVATPTLSKFAINIDDSENGIGPKDAQFFSMII